MIRIHKTNHNNINLLMKKDNCKTLVMPKIKTRAKTLAMVKYPKFRNSIMLKYLKVNLKRNHKLNKEKTIKQI